MATPVFGGEAQATADETAWLEAHFEACAPEYHAMLAAAGIRPGDHVLDLGCGSGQFLGWIAEMAGPQGRITAIDLSPGNTEAAALRGAALLPRPALLAADALRIPLADSCVDVVWCANTFEYLTAVEQSDYLREMTRVTRPGGTIAVKDSEFTHKIFHPADLGFWLRFLQQLAVADGGPFVGRRLPAAFRAAGLTPTVRTFLSERTGPLGPVDRRWIGLSGRAVAADAMRLLGQEDAAAATAFDRQFDDGPECVLDRDEFYYCEGSIVLVAQTPVA
jgi:ubiquinone/menaquinone biosynthesis C-methylase UbiE